jgi:hypothetical protein
MISKDPRYESKKRWHETHREQHNESNREWAIRNPEYQINYRKLHPDANRAKNYDRKEYDKIYRQTHKEQNRAKINKWHKLHPKIRKAERLARDNVPLGSHCEICYSIKDLQRAHFDYDKPLEVHTFCVKCHAMIDHTIVPNITDPKIATLLFQDALVTYSL